MIKDLRSDKKTDSNKILDMTHSLLLENRERMALGGVTEVCGFSESSISLKTVCGALLVKGKKLSMSKLNTETGELSVSGDIMSIQYSHDKKKGSLLEGLFK